MSRKINITQQEDGTCTVELHFQGRTEEPSVHEKVGFLVDAAGYLLDISEAISAATEIKQPLANQ